MNLSIMRKIDYYIGIPLCFCLSLLHSLVSLFKSSRRTHNTKVSKFLILQLSEMGSTLLAYPFLKKLQKKHPQSKIYFLIFKKNKICLDLLKIIPEDQIYTINTDSLFTFLKDTVNIILALRRLSIDFSIDLELFSRFSAAISYLSGARKRAGYFRFHMEGLYRGNFLTHRIMYNFHYHISKNFLSFLQVTEKPFHLVSALPLKEDIQDEELPHMDIPTQNKDQLLQRLQDIYQNPLDSSTLFVLFYVSGGILPIRSWPKAYFTELGNKILIHPNTLLILIGDNQSVKESDDIYRSFEQPSRCINLAGKTTLYELITLYQLSHILVSNDGGPAQFASLAPHLKTFVFYGPESPLLYKPLGKNIHCFYSDLPCSPCLTSFNHRHSSCERSFCLENISSDTVFDKIMLNL